MKKIVVSVAIVLALVLGLGTEVYAREITLKINNRIIETAVSPIQEFGTTLVPIRVIAEHLGATIEWKQTNQTITIRSKGAEIRLAIGSKTAYVNNIVEQLQCAPQLVKGTTMVPIRLISEQLEYEVQWEEETGTVSIRGNSNTGVSNNEVVKVTICQYIELPETARADNVFEGRNAFEYFEIRVDGEIDNLKWVTVGMNKLLEATEESRASDWIQGVLMEFGKVSNDTFIIHGWAAEGIPIEALVWTWPSGREGIYFLTYDGRDNQQPIVIEDKE